MKKSRQKRKKIKTKSLWHQIYTRHFLLFSLYTVAIVIVSSVLTSFIFLAGVNFLQKRLLEQALLIKPLKSNQQTADFSLYGEKNIESGDNSSDQESAGIILHGSRDKKQIALTFDAEMTDGMKANLLSGTAKNSYDSKVTDILDKTQTKATFFLTGMWIELYPDITKKLADDPLFELGSHSYADTSYDGYCFGLKQIKEDQYLEEIETTQKLLRDVAGIQNKYFRFPGGCYSQKSKDIVINTAGLKIVHWDVSGVDGFTNNTEQIVSNVVSRVQNGSIIVLHLNGAPTAPKTAEALPEIISQLKQKGFIFLKVSELLGSS